MVIVFDASRGWNVNVPLVAAQSVPASADTSLVALMVIDVMAEDIPPLRPLAERTAIGSPSRAVLLQGALALAFVLTDSFEGVLTYAGFTLTLFALLAVVGVIVLRVREPDRPRPWRTWGYPWTPLFFTAFSLWTVIVVIRDLPMQAVGGVVTLGVGALLTWVVGEKS